MNQEFPTEEEYIKNLFPSVKELSKKDVQENGFTSWLSNQIFQALFETGHYKKISTYAIYIELDTNGNRRNIEIPYEAKFYWSVKTGRLLHDFHRFQFH